MGLLHYYTRENKVTSKALQVSYTSRFANRVAGVDVYEVHRIATKAYAYVGMDEATARACARAKEAQYTRVFVQLYTEQHVYRPRNELKCVASVSCDHDAAGMWSVSIAVNEDQAQYCTNAEWGDWSHLFDESLDYDEDEPQGGMLMITGCYVQGGQYRMSYQQAIKGFAHTSALLHVESASGVKGPWAAVTPASLTADAFAVPIAGAANFYRLRWGDDLCSNTFAPNATGYSYAGEISGLVSFAGGWRFAFSFDVPNFDRTLMGISVKMASGGGYVDVTNECNVRAGMAYLPATLGPDADFFVRCYYPTGDITTNVLHSVYVPQEDTGDGSIQPLAWLVNCLAEDPELWIATAPGVEYDAITAMTSADGQTWTAADVLDARAPGRVTIREARRYVKLFVNGVQASCGVDRGAYGGGDLAVVGFDITDNSHVSDVMWESTIEDFDPELVTVKYSANGSTYFTVSGAPGDAGFSINDPIALSNSMFFNVSYPGRDDIVVRIPFYG